MSDDLRSSRLGPPLLMTLLATGPVQAQIVTDGSVGPKTTLSGPQVEIGADLGSRRGDNLFHSFEKFGIATGQTTTFTGPDTIKNVIGRVTGGEISAIDGTLASRVGQADLYFLNPAGVVFGPNARLDLPGSLHVSTAHELRFADGARFSALDTTGSGLTVAPPEAFGFLDRPSGRIAVDQSELRLSPGKTFSLVGGDLMIDGGLTGSVGATDGVVLLISVAAPGAVRIADAATTVGRRGEVRVTQSADRLAEVGQLGSVDVSGSDGGGAIRIRGGRVSVDGARIFADNYGSRDSTGGVDLQADRLVMRNGIISSDTIGNGKAGTVAVTAGELELHDGGQIHSDSWGTGDGGQVNVTAERLLVAGYGSQIHSDTIGRGEAGTVAVTAGELELHDGGQITSWARPGSTGVGGAVAIRAENIILRDRGAVLAESDGTGPGGPLSISAGTLRMDNAAIRVWTASAMGGDVQVVASRHFSLRNSAVTISIAGGARSGGNIVIYSPLMVLNQSHIQANARLGSGGNIHIAAGQLIKTPDSMIQASSSLVISGTIISNIADILTVLPATFLDAGSQLRETCAARGGRPASSLSPGRRGGQPPDPGAPLAGHPFGVRLKQQAATGSSTALAARLTHAAKPIRVAGTPQPVLGAPRPACRG